MSRRNPRERAQAAGARPQAAARPSLHLHPDMQWHGLPKTCTIDEIRKAFGPAFTLGASEDARLAMDAQLDSDGVYTLLQHSLSMGQAIGPQFMGYGALQNIAQNGLIRACIETVADDMTREWITLKGGDDEERIRKLDEAQRERDLQSTFHEAAALVGYEGGAFIFIDTGAGDEQLMTPLHMGRFNAEFDSGRPLRFVVIDPVNVFPGDYNSTSPLRQDYFRPRWWWVLGLRVHASRLVRLVANEVPVLLKPSYNFLGMAQAQILWDYVLHFQQCREAEARLLTKFSLTVFQTNMTDLLTQAGGTAQIDSRIRYMIQNMSNDGILAIDKEMENVIKLETPLSGVTDIVRQALEFLAALNRTPAVKLLGISPSGFNATGESDLRNYYDHIASQQEKVLRPGIKKILDCIQLHEFGGIDSALDFDFAPLGEEDRAAIASQQKTRADTMAVYLDRGVISQEESRMALASDPDSGFADIDPGEVPDVPEEAGPAGQPYGDLDDVDKAGAVYDWALDAKEGDGDWITTSQGKHVELDPETGKPLKGNIGQKDFSYQSEPLASTKPDMARYHELVVKNDGNHMKAAHEYYREKLQGRHVEAQADNGPIKATFTGGSWQELKKRMRDDPVKASLVPCLPDIILTGQYSPEIPSHSHPDVVVFHTYRKIVQTKSGPKEVIVDVAERVKPELSQPKYQVYNLTREGTRNYEDRNKKSSASDSGRILIPAEDLLDKNNISPAYEVVNIRFE